MARSAEAKALGVPDLGPFFKVEAKLRRHGVAVFSSNYPLYGDISRRVMKTLEPFSPRIEVYSIDEAFIDLAGGTAQYAETARDIRARCWRDVRIPVSVGAAATKTLAKLANRAAKRFPELGGVCVLDERNREAFLRRFPVTGRLGRGCANRRTPGGARGSDRPRPGPRRPQDRPPGSGAFAPSAPSRS